MPGGCAKDPPCLPPYTSYRHQCLHFSQTPLTVAAARQFCQDRGGFLPYDFLGFWGEEEVGELWHWVNYAPEEGRCGGCRPGRWGEGVRPVSCQDTLRVACQRKRAFPLPRPPRPRTFLSATDQISNTILYSRPIIRAPGDLCSGGKCFSREKLLLKLISLQREKARRQRRRHSSNPYLTILK